jgi:hypothetical protein
MAPSQEVLLSNIIRLCNQIHGRDHVTGWEVSLFNAIINRAKIDGLTYDDLTEMLGLYLMAGGWFLWVRDEPVFKKKSEWMQILKSL